MRVGLWVSSKESDVVVNVVGGDFFFFFLKLHHYMHRSVFRELMLIGCTTPLPLKY